MTSAEREQIQPLVEGWLPAQRWFAGKGRGGSIALAELAPLPGASPPVTIWTATVHYDDGGTEVYQLPLVVYDTAVEGLEHVLLGTFDSPDGTRWVYDALHDKEVTGAWLTNTAEQTVAGGLRFARYVEADDIPVGHPSLALTGEQSNTSLMYSDLAILKVFRRLQAGVNPDIEILEALTKEGARHVPRLLGAAFGETEGDSYALAMLQEYMTTASDGWELAKISVRDLMAEADLHAEEAGGDFAGEAERLGLAVAEVHADLVTAFGTSTAGAEELQVRAAGMHQRLDRAAEIVPALAPLAPGLHRLFDGFGDLDGELALQRIHGDLHLGQVLRTVHRWVLIDFEGEPMVDIEVRRRPDSPLRDVAGMLRSFEYAGRHRLVEVGFLPQLAYRAAEWTQRNRDAFCTGYSQGAGADPREQAVALRAFEADKAVYEAVYETRHRPDWVAIPLDSLTRLADTEETA